MLVRLLVLSMPAIAHAASAPARPGVAYEFLDGAFDLAAPAAITASAGLGPELAADDEETCPSGGVACGMLSLRQLRAAELRGRANSGVSEMELAEATEVAASQLGPEGIPETAPAEAPAASEALPGGWGEAAEYAMAHAPAESQADPSAGSEAFDGGGGGAELEDVWKGLMNASALSAPHLGRVKVLYHQTSPKAAHLILKHGFRPGSVGWCGGGIYFATSPGATYKKAIGPDSQKGYILAARVDIGKVKHMGPACDDHLNSLTLRAQHYDSVRFNPGDGTEYVVYSKHQVLSVRVVHRHHHRRR